MNSIEVAIGTLGPAAQKFAYPLENAMIKGGILSPIEKAHFLAQLAHESANFSRLEENLNYSWQRLRVVFPKYFPNDEFAKLYDRKPQKIASRTYANRFGNGGEHTGDGYTYRGRSPIQLTFKDNYMAASKAIYGDDRLVKHPDLALEVDVGSAICVWYWNSRDCCGPSRRDDCEAVTRKINGGTIGLKERKELTEKLKQLFL